MFSFNNDYSEGAHPSILDAIAQSNHIQNAGYGLDIHSDRARELIKKELKKEADIHFLVGGTQTNRLMISAALRPHQCVISASSGHINVHEAGAIESSGHKVIPMDCRDGKLTISEIQCALDHHTDEHMVLPKMVYISNTTEVGTQYSKEELKTLWNYCQEKNLFLFLDGARLGSALTSDSNDLTLADLAKYTDAFYIGGTKNGALFGEALVIINDSLKPDFRYMMKQQGALMAKGWLLGIQFETLFQDELFYDLAKHANQMATSLREGIQSLGYSFHWDSKSNQLFPIFPNDVICKLRENFVFYDIEVIDEAHTCIRLVTSWDTKQDAVTCFIHTLEAISPSKS